MTVTDHGDLVSALLGVPGVAAAAVEPTAGGPGTLRLQLAPGADEVGVAGAVNRMLRSRFGLAVDADRVRVLGEPPVRPAVIPANGLSTQSNSIVPPELRPDVRPEVRAEPRPDPRPEVRAEPRPEVRADPSPAVRPATAPADSDVWHPTPRRPLPAAVEATPAPAPATARSTPRLLIERVQLVSSGLTTSVTVALSRDGRTVEGRADGTATAGSLHRSVAHATLRAVEQVTDDVRFDVEHVEVAQTGPDRTALVVVSMVTERANQRLSGASVVREDVRQAVIRAVLAAVNRRLEPLIANVDLAATTSPAGGREDLRR